jgi:uracil-DNA glycosylase
MPENLDMIDAPQAASILRWWADAGVDCLTEDAALPWLNRSKATVSDKLPREEAISMPATLAGLDAWLRSAALPLLGPAAQRIPASGQGQAELMILIDIPEAGDADRHVLLSGACAEMFEKMLTAINHDRASTYIAALSPARPATAMIPEADLKRLGEIALHHIALVRPKRLWLMGSATSRAVLGMDLAEARKIKHNINHDGSNVVAVASFAPAFLLQNPRRKADAWADMQLLVEGMNA